MVVSRALTTTVLRAERQRLRLRYSGLVHREGVCGFSSQGRNAASALLPFRRNASSTAPMLQVPRESSPAEEHADKPHKKSILGLDFLSKLFGRNHEEAAAVSEAHPGALQNAAETGAREDQNAAVEEAGTECSVQEHNADYAVGAASDGAAGDSVPVSSEESGLQEPNAEYALEAASESTLDYSPEATSQEALTDSASGTAHSDAVEAAAAEQVVTADSAADSNAVEAEQTTVTDSSAAEGAVPGESVGVAAETVEKPVTTIQDFIDSLPPLSATAVRPASEQTATVPTTPTTQKPAAEKAPPKETPAKEAEASSSEKPVSAKASAKPGVKPAKKPNPTKASTPVAADATPMYDFLRQKLRDPASDGDAKQADTKPAEPPKPPSLKLSLTSAQKTNAAINTLLDTVDKSTKAAAPAPLSIFDALHAKPEESNDTPAPSLRLSLSSAPAERAPMDAQTLAGEMNLRLTDGKLAEAVILFEDWRSAINPLTLEPNKPDRALYNLYMQAKLQSGADFGELSEVVSEMEEAGLPRDLAGYNILIRALFRKKDSTKAESILERMEKEEPQAQPDADSYNLVVVLCALDRKVNAAMKHMKTMIDKGFEPTRTTINEVLLASARSHQTRMAASLLKDLKASGKFPMPMLNTCAELLMSASEVDDNECARLALASISERPMAKFGPKMILDEGTMISVLGTASRTGDSVLSNKAWEAICSHTRGMGRVPCPESFLARIHALTSTGDLASAFKAVYEFEVCHLKKGEADAEMFSPFTSLKSLATACSRGGATALDAAYYKVEEAHSKKEGVALAALNCIILGCSNLWDSERAFQTFEAIENVFGLRPDLHSCNALLQALGRTKMTEDALKVFEYIKEAGFKPNTWTYMLLAEAHVVNHDSNAALDVVQTMIDAGHRPLRQTFSKVWTRCKQYEDNDGLERLKKLESLLNYRYCYFANNRRKLLLDMIRSA